MNSAGIRTPDQFFDLGRNDAESAGTQSSGSDADEYRKPRVSRVAGGADCHSARESGISDILDGDVTADEFGDGLRKAEKSIDFFLNLVASRLGLDHDRVLASRAAFPLLSRYFWQRGGRLVDSAERDRLLYWYIQTMLWGRYAGSTETVLNQDLEQIENLDGAFTRLIAQFRQSRSDLRVVPEDFAGWSKGARFYPMLYMLTRVRRALDWETGVELSALTLGKFTDLHVHHIFPKARLYAAGYSRTEVNALANFTFLTAETNIRVSDRLPKEYLAEFAAKDESLISSHWIPLDPSLWQIERYRDFLAARRELIAEEANRFLDSLVKGAVPEGPEMTSILEREIVSIPGGVTDGDEEALLGEVNAWVEEQGLPRGELSFELTAEDGALLGVLDLAWPSGLQEGLSDPATLLIDEEPKLEEIVNQAGYRFFTDVSLFKEYVEREILARDDETSLEFKRS